VHIELCETNEIENKTMASVYYETMMSLMEKNASIMDIEADLGACILAGNVKKMQETYPSQFVNCGIQEANMVGVACGLSATGKIPYIHTFAPFLSRRANDQIFISGCYAGANVRLIGSDPGVTASYNGGTHMPFEDIAALHAFPGLTILEPSDSTMLADLLRQLENKVGMFYVRVVRKNMVKLYEEGSSFEIGSGVILRKGGDVTIVASGIMVEEGLKAAQLLSEQGISAELVDMFSIKPIDKELLIASAKKTGAVVTAENHNIIGGLGSAVAEVLSCEYPVVIERVGVDGVFGEVGPVEFLKNKFHLTAEDIARKAVLAISKK